MKKNKYVLAAFALVFVIFLFEYYFLEPQSRALRETIETKYNVLQKYEFIIKGGGVTEESIKSDIDNLNNIEAKLIQGKTDFLASAELQNAISGLTDKAGLKVLVIRPLSSVKINKYQNIPLYFEGNGTIKQISDFLKLIESDNLMIKVDKLSINITNLQTSNDLKFKMQVSGLTKI